MGSLGALAIAWPLSASLTVAFRGGIVAGL
jgi:hypothetical protein